MAVPYGTVRYHTVQYGTGTVPYGTLPYVRTVRYGTATTRRWFVLDDKVSYDPSSSGDLPDRCKHKAPFYSEIFCVFCKCKAYSELPKDIS